ncbi:MAG: fimbrillin family protein [Bacteroides sp.]|nr:fimbrillin family protein [Bacteroides sp.]
MKLRKCLYAGMALWSFWLVGCASDDATTGPDPSVDPDEKVAIHVSAGFVTTRAADDHWDTLDSIGISMFQPSNREVIDGSFNREYITPGGNGTFTPANSATTIYFPQDGSQVAFKAYYPYWPALSADNMDYPVSVTNQSNLPRIDLMTSEHVSGTSRSTPNVVLRFHHRLSKLVFNIKFEEEYFTLEGGSLMIKGMKTQGSYELYEDVLTVDQSSTADISVPLTVASDSLTGRAIVLPREAADGIDFVITTSTGEVFTARMDDDLDLESGYRYIFTIYLRKTGVSTIRTTIEDWIEGRTSDLEAS